MSQNREYTFYNDPERRPADAHEKSPSEPEPYIALPPLIQAVNLAIYLRRPLLLEGEAGCGKTRLARAVAYELGLPFYAWYVRSTSIAQEGLYTYDAILRLHDVHTAQLDIELKRDPTDAKSYRRLGALGKAFASRECPAVVLIDEIDKADLDFPNDLLAVLDDPWKFEIPETGETIEAEADHKPIVIITSNKEKGNLPAPFLRRCLYYFIRFPDDERRLKDIVDAHYQTRGKETSPSKELIGAAIKRFLNLRAKDDLHKKPGTSEFLDWLEALQNFGASPHQPALLSQDRPIPYPELLFKLRPDWRRHAVTG